MITDISNLIASFLVEYPTYNAPLDVQELYDPINKTLDRQKEIERCEALSKTFIGRNAKELSKEEDEAYSKLFFCEIYRPNLVLESTFEFIKASRITYPILEIIGDLEFTKLSKVRETTSVVEKDV